MMNRYHFNRIQAQPGNTLQTMVNNDNEVSLCWTGNDGWLLHHKGCTLAFDLDLLDAYRLAESPVKTGELARHLDYLFISHEHNDHFHAETAEHLNRDSVCRFVLPESCLEKAKSLSIPEERIIVSRPGQPFNVSNIKVEPTRALHGHIKNSVYKEANLKDCGYILNLSGMRVFQPGDTVLLYEHLEMENIDVLFVSPTEHNTQVKPSVEMINAIDPAFIFPQHYATYPVDEENYFWTRGYTEELYSALPERMKQRYIKLPQGEIFAFSALK